MRQFTRVTDAFSNKLENNAPIVALCAFWYNRPRVHKTRCLNREMAADLMADVARRIGARLLGLAGGACAIVVVLTHVAERFAILPGMGWGLPNSPGHYLDLICATAGLALLLAAGIVRLLQPG